MVCIFIFHCATVQAENTKDKKRIWQSKINCSFTIMNSLMFANIGINETFVKFFWLNKFRVHMLLQCSNISSHFQPMLSTVLPCWIKTFQHVRLEPELLLWLPEFQPYSRVANSRKRSFSLSRTLLPLSSVKAPDGYPYKIQKIESAWKRWARGRGGLRLWNGWGCSSSRLRV